MNTDPDSQQEASDPETSKQPDQDGKSIDKKADGAVNPPAQEKQNPNASSELIVLSPHYDEKHHGLYVEKLEQAVRNPKVRNIALTGSYGTGKSSVIQGLIERIHSSKELKKIRPITISLPPIQIADESDSGDNRTDRIQREIVKQLLYRSNPRKMRGSQYRRITHVTTAQRATVCFIVAAILTFAFWFLAKPDWHWHWSQGGSLRGYWQPAVVQVISWGLTFYIDWIWVDKPTLKGLELGPTKLELDKNDSNYFDKYLNEIIYYFEVSGTNLVIFEDLDRFDNPYIFDALHELNELINISLGQERFTEQKNPSVKFLYSTRDSIFEHKTKGIIENADTRYAHRLEIENRTKFFDVIVPIIPFSTSRNAYEYLKQLIDNNSFPITIDRKLLEIVGSEISDYRLLANIVSEFQIFTEQIFASWGNEKETAEFFKDHANYLFAFVAYKNTHLTDYERIRIQDSNIDKINMRFSKMKMRVKIMSLKLLGKFNDNLKSEIEKRYKVDPALCGLFLNGKWFDHFITVELWEKGLELNLSPIRAPISLVYPDGHTITNDFDSNIFCDIIANEFTNENSSFKRENLHQKVITSIKVINSMDISRFLRHQHKEFILPKNIQKEVDDFKDFIEKIFFHDRLTKELMTSNYIDSNFYAYASIFTKGFTNIKVFNFLIKNIETGQPDINLRFTEQEVREIIYQLKYTKSNLNIDLKGALNVDLLLYLSSRESNQPLSIMLHDIKQFFESNFQNDREIRIKLISTVLGRLLDGWKKENDYHSNAVNSYDNIKRLLKRIISFYPNILLECFGDNLTDKQKYLLIDSALTKLHVPTTFDIKKYIKNNIQDIISHIESTNTTIANTNEDIRLLIDDYLGLNPLITPHCKKIMKLMLANKQLRNISEEKIDTLKNLNDVCEKAEFYDREKAFWIPLQGITEYELECIKHQNHYFPQEISVSSHSFSNEESGIHDYFLFIPQQDSRYGTWSLDSNEGRKALFNVLRNRRLTGMNREDIEKVTSINDIPKDAMFFDYFQQQWYPVRDALAFRID